jgi:hypothetical protein
LSPAAVSDSKGWNRATRALAGLGLLLLLALLVVGVGRGAWGDEDTYLAMTASLARDGDLMFEEPDRDWALGRSSGLPATLILQRVGSRVSYSKPVAYPLLALPFYGVLGESGLQVANLLMMAGALFVAWRYLRRLGPADRATLTLVTFAACGVLPFYLGWQMSDVAQASLCLAGLTLVAGSLRASGDAGWWSGAVIGGLMLGLLAEMRLPGLALAAAAVAAGLWVGRRRRAVVVALAALLGFALASGAGLALTGSANPYKEVRSGFSEETGYPLGEDEAWQRFDRQPATQSAGWLPRFEWSRSAYSGYYFLVGRHTGVLFYFPAVLALLAAALSRRDRIALALLAGPVAVTLFYLLWLPENYFGGSTFFGNRYFLMAYPALLAALSRLPSARSLAISWMVGLVVGGSALASMLTYPGGPGPSQSHATAGVFRLLPSETTALQLDGFRGRYWGRDFVRFVDPFARDDGKVFRLVAGGRPAELELAFRIPRDTLRLEVDPGDSPGELVWSDWLGSGRMALAPGPQGVELPLSPAWRRHTYWWQVPDLYQVRALRLAYRAAAGGELVVRHVGGPFRPRQPDRGGG